MIEISQHLRGTSNKHLCFGGCNTDLASYVELDLVGDIDTMQSTTSYIFTIGGIAVSWISQLQNVVALSTMKVEYVAIREARKEMIWLQSFMEELGK